MRASESAHETDRPACPGHEGGGLCRGGGASVLIGVMLRQQPALAVDGEHVGVGLVPPRGVCVYRGGALVVYMCVQCVCLHVLTHVHAQVFVYA